MQNDGSISLVKAFFHSKWVKIILVLNVLAVIVVIGIIIFNATKTATINFNVVPADAKIQLNGLGNYTNGSYQVHPGKYEITVSHDDLASKTFTLNLESDYDTTLTTFLSGEGNNYEYYELKNNYESFQKLAIIASSDNNITTDQDQSAEQFIARYNNAYDLWKNKLPIVQSIYGSDNENRMSLSMNVNIRVSYDSDCKKTLCILASMIGGGANKNYIDQLLINNGFNLEDYEIHYEIF